LGFWNCRNGGLRRRIFNIDHAVRDSDASATTRVARVAGGGDELRAAAALQAEAEAKLRGDKIAVEALQKALDADQAKAAAHDDAVAFAAEKVMAAHFDGIAQGLLDEIRDEQFEFRAIAGALAVPEWRTITAYPAPFNVKGRRRLNYGQNSAVALDQAIGVNGAHT
jgi:hypothetical protein